MAPFAHKDQAGGESFLGALDGAPRVIVTDAENALALAVKSVFQDAAVEHRLCEWHLTRKLGDHLPDELLPPQEVLAEIRKLKQGKQVDVSVG